MDGKSVMDERTVVVRPRLRVPPHYAIPIGDHELQVRSAQLAVSFRGTAARQLLPRVLPLLDGSRTEEDLVRDLHGQIPGATVRTLVRFLLDKGLLILDPAPVDAAPFSTTLRRYFDRESGIGTSAPRAPFELRLLVVDPFEIGSSAMVALRDCGLSNVTLLRHGGGSWPETAAEWSRTLVDCDAALAISQGPALTSAWLQPFNQAAVARELCFSVVSLLTDRAIQVGPSVIPGDTACLACLKSQFEKATSFLEEAGFPEWLHDLARANERPSAPSTVRIAASFMAGELMSFLGLGSTPVSLGRVRTLDLTRLRTRDFKVGKLPRCPVCGPSSRTAPMRVWS